MMRWLLLLLVLCQAGCFEVRYVLGQVGDLVRLMQARRPVEDVLADPGTTPLQRQRLRLALAARQFGIDELGLVNSADFTRFTRTNGPLGYNLSVAQQTRLELVRFGFGLIPYLGYLSPASAQQAVASFQQRGLDTYLRPIEAFSGLGLLLSPIYSSMIDDPGPRGAYETVEVVLHELAHCTVPFIRGGGQALAEPFATTVGRRGAERFYREHGWPLPENSVKSPLVGPPTPPPVRFEQAGTAWLRESIAQLRQFYQRAAQQGLSRAQILQQREAEFLRIDDRYREVFRLARRQPGQRPRFNNATLLSLAVYFAPGEVNPRPRSPSKTRPAPKPSKPPLSLTDLQGELLKSLDGDVHAFVELYKRAEPHPDPIGWLRAELAWRQGQPAGPAKR